MLTMIIIITEHYKIFVFYESYSTFLKDKKGKKEYKISCCFDTKYLKESDG